MENKENTTEANAPAIVPAESASEAEAKIAALETEKAKLLAERDNYKTAYLKEVKKDSSGNPEETDEERTRRIVREESTSSRISQIDKEKEDLFQKTIKENKELKTALSNKPGVPASTAASTEATASVVNTLVTPDQLKYFKETLKWSDKDVERYKKSIQKRV